MKRNTRYLKIAAGACLAALSCVAHAENAAQALAIPSIASPYTGGSRSYMVALNDAGAVKEQPAAMPAAPAAAFEPPLFSGSNAHKYLGLTTLGLVVATALAPKPDGDRSTQALIDEQESSNHAKLGRAAAVFAAATVTTGLVAHWDDFHLEDGLTDPDNLHALLGTAGALAMLVAVSNAPEGAHAGKGMLGGLAMGAAIKLTW